MRAYIFIFLSLILVGCVPKTSVDNYKVVDKFKDENLSYEIKKDWYELYNQKYLKLLIDRALNKNQDIAVATLNTLQAYARAGVIEADMLPTFIASYQVDAQRRIDRHNSSWNDKYGINLSASYEIDFFGKIKNSASAYKWKAIASEFDKQSLELSIINSVINAYFKELFLNDILNLLNENYKNYQELYRITNLKLKEGKISQDQLLETKKSILTLENRIISYKNDKLSNEELLKNLLFLDKNENLQFSNLSLNSVNFIGVDLSIPFYTLTNRPDLNALISKLNSSFYDYKTNKKAFYPTITIGSAISSSDSNLKDSFELTNLSANLRINLPFLNYKKLKNQLKVSELEFKKNAINYEKKILEIINKIDKLSCEYKNTLSLLNNSKKTLNNDKKLLDIYYNRYKNGVYEFKDYLNSKNSYISSQINYLEQKYRVLNIEVAIYKTLTGKFIGK